MKLDTAKILVQIAWEIKSIDNKKYAEISEKLYEIGKMLGGWHNQIKNKTLLPK
jgi:ribonuclease HIII